MAPSFDPPSSRTSSVERGARYSDSSSHSATTPSRYSLTQKGPSEAAVPAEAGGEIGPFGSQACDQTMP